MTERLAGVRDTLTKNYEEIHGLIGGLSDADLAKTTENGWTVRQLAGHIAGSPNGDLYVLKRLRQGKNATLPGFLMFIINIMNFMGARKFKTASREEILGEHEKKHNELFAYMNSLKAEELDKRGTCLGMGELSVLEYLGRSPEHEQEHAADIRKVTGGA